MWFHVKLAQKILNVILPSEHTKKYADKLLLQCGIVTPKHTNFVRRLVRVSQHRPFLCQDLNYVQCMEVIKLFITSSDLWGRVAFRRLNHKTQQKQFLQPFFYNCNLEKMPHLISIVYDIHGKLFNLRKKEIIRSIAKNFRSIGTAKLKI